MRWTGLAGRAAMIVLAVAGAARAEDVAARNVPGLLKIAVPTLILQGDADRTVFPAATDALAAALCAGGNAVEYRVLAGADHDGAMSGGAGAALAFLSARFAGAEFAPTCAALPRAAAP